MVEVAEVEDLEFKWGEKGGIGGKKGGTAGKKGHAQFYRSFSFDGEEYALYDCVYMYKGDDDEPHIGKLIKLWETADKMKRVKVLWFFRPCEISNYLGNDQTLKNELFLACGEGVGLTNVNPLEAIAGKCNVVCISKDGRNRQPSDEELQMAHFVFYRAFDVGQCKILDTLDEMVASIEVKFIFNRENCQKSGGNLKFELDEKEVGRDGEGTIISSKQSVPEEHKSAKKEGDFIGTSAEGNAKASLVKQKSLLVEERDAMLGESAKTNDGQENASNDKTTLNSEVKENTYSKVPMFLQKSLVGEKPTSIIDAVEVANTTDKHKNIHSDKNDLQSKVQENVDSRASLVRQKSSLGEKIAPREGLQIGETVKTSDRHEKIYHDKTTSSSKVPYEKMDGEGAKDFVTKGKVEEAVKSTKDASELDNRPSKKAKLESSHDDKNKDSEKKLGCDSNGNVTKVKAIVPTFPGEDKSKLVITKDSHGIDKGLSKKPNVDEKVAKLTNAKLTKASSGRFSDVVNNNAKLTKASLCRSSDAVKNNGYKVLEVTRRPNLDRNRWFRELPWEERMQKAHEQGTLVLLENLDPSYTSTEVEDIIWHAFEEHCSAKMVQRTAFSSPHSGQAFAIFKTREAVEIVVSKLDEGCLLLSNGRPLVGSIRTPCFRGRQSTFNGHVGINKLKYQMQRETREAVGTSHCSQPNTLEYDLALDWCFQQEKSDRAWKKLYQRQGEELEKLKAKLRST